MSIKIKLSKGDLVKVITGSLKGKTGKVVSVQPQEGTVKVEGLNVVKRHVKPSITSPQGGIVDLHKPIDTSKLAIVVDDKKNTTSRVGYNIDKNGNKVRVYRQANNKEINS
jgi:large subunit ribosomal protein L24